MTTIALSAAPRRWVSRALTWILVASVAVLVVGAVIAMFSGRSDYVGWDLRVAYLPAAEDVRVGVSPYPDPDDPALDLKRAYVYPPQLAITLVPLSRLPVDFATLIAFLLALSALVTALWIVGVRDLRCYAAMLLWAPTWNALATLNVSAGLALGVALLWRYRATLWPLAATLGVMVSIKLFAWPLGIWLALTNRLRPAALALAVGGGLTLVSWALIGFRGIGDYPDLLARVDGQENYSIVAMATELGLGARVGEVVALAVGGAVLGHAVLRWRRGEHETGFALAVAATLALSPVIWLHYLTLLIAPLGLLRPRFGLIWFLPMLLWVSPRDGNGTGLQPYVPALFVAAFIFLVVTRRQRQQPACPAT